MNKDKLKHLELETSKCDECGNKLMQITSYINGKAGDHYICNVKDHHVCNVCYEVFQLECFIDRGDQILKTETRGYRRSPFLMSI